MLFMVIKRFTRGNRLLYLVAALFAALAIFATVPGALPARAQAPPRFPAAAYPLKQSANRRYLVDRNNRPFLITGDAPQALMVNLPEADADLYFANRKAHGFNTLWINLLCKPGTGGRKDGSTYDS